MKNPTPAQIETWVKANFPEHKERKDGSELVIPSPFSHNDKFKFNISVDDGICHDWRGDDWTRGGPATFLRFVQLYRNCSFQQAYKEVTGLSIDTARYNLNKKENDDIKEEIEEIKLPPGTSQLGDNKVAQICFNWLKSRGINQDKIEAYNIQHCGLKVVWPYYEFDQFVYWQSRDVTDKVFAFPEETEKGEYFYRFDHVKASGYVVVTEAIVDALTIEDQTLASGGASLTKRQVQKLKLLNPVKGVILAPDNDQAGISSIMSNAKMLQPYFNVYYSIPPDVKDIKDWNDVGKQYGWDRACDVLESNITPYTPDKVMKLIDKLSYV